MRETLREDGSVTDSETRVQQLWREFMDAYPDCVRQLEIANQSMAIYREAMDALSPRWQIVTTDTSKTVSRGLSSGVIE